MSVTYGYRAARCGFSLGAHAPGGLSIGVDVLEDGTVVKRMDFNGLLLHVSSIWRLPQLHRYLLTRRLHSCV
jgi:hypothetical protein